MRTAWMGVCAIAMAASAGTEAAADRVEKAIEAAQAHRAEQGADILRRYVEFLKIPNVAGDTGNIRRNAEEIVRIFTARGFAMKVLESPKTSPLVYGVRRVPGARRTIAIYIHYDGQPVDKDQWTHDPFTPVLYDGVIDGGGKPIPLPEKGRTIGEDWRLYARSASDDKAPVAALAAALDALDGAGISPTSNLKLLFDGEEEAGSDELPAYLDRMAGELEDVDLWLFLDGPSHQTGRPQLVYGVRGVTGIEITVYGPNRGLHSGHYGNWAPDPGMRLARLLGSMEDGNGRVLIKDFYKDTQPISAAERAAIAAAPSVDDELRRKFGLARTEADNAPLGERIMLPSLTVRGLAGGGVGARARNQIIPHATANLEVRLAKGDDPERMKNRIEAHLELKGYHIVREDPDEKTRLAHGKIAKVVRQSGYPAMRTPIGAAGTEALVAAVRRAASETLLIPTLGGSLPLFMFEQRSAAPIIILPIANFDNNQHAPDENIRMGHLMRGIDIYAAVLAMD